MFSLLLMVCFVGSSGEGVNKDSGEKVENGDVVGLPLRDASVQVAITARKVEKFVDRIEGIVNGYQVAGEIPIEVDFLGFKKVLTIRIKILSAPVIVGEEGKLK